MPKTAN